MATTHSIPHAAIRNAARNLQANADATGKSGMGEALSLCPDTKRPEPAWIDLVGAAEELSEEYEAGLCEDAVASLAQALDYITAGYRDGRYVG